MDGRVGGVGGGGPACRGKSAKIRRAPSASIRAYRAGQRYALTHDPAGSELFEGKVHQINAPDGTLTRRFCANDRVVAGREGRRKELGERRVRNGESGHRRRLRGKQRCLNDGNGGCAGGDESGIGSDQRHCSVEIGSISWSPPIPLTTDADRSLSAKQNRFCIFAHEAIKSTHRSTSRQPSCRTAPLTLFCIST